MAWAALRCPAPAEAWMTRIFIRPYSGSLCFSKPGKLGVITVDDGNGFQEIGCDKIRTHRPRAHVPAVFAAGKNKDRFTSGLVPGEDVGFRVADKERLLRRADALVHRFKGLAHGPDFRLAAVAPFIRAMRAIKNPLDPTPCSSDLIKHIARDVAKLLFRIDAFAHTSLIGYDKNREALFGKGPQSLQGTGDKMEFLEFRDVFTVAGKLVDDSI